MNKILESIIEDLMNGFQLAKGNAYAKILPPIDINIIIEKFIEKYRIKRKDSKIYIVKNNFNVDIKEFDKVKVFGINSINPFKYIENVEFVITINCPIRLIKEMDKPAKFMFNIYNYNLSKDEETELNKYYSKLTTKFSSEKLHEYLLNLPVIGYIHSCELNDNDREEYNKLEEYINKYISIFGSIENINYCREGDKVLNISASSFRYEFAKSNGWHEKLDVSIPYNKEIDKYYNPNTLLEYAVSFYKLVPKRKALVLNNPNKINKIIEIIDEYPDKKILIVSKNGEFATQIAEELNTHYNSFVCGQYHDSIPSTYLYDDNNEIIKYKSGAMKGKPKIFGSRHLSKSYEELYINNNINILSIKFSSDNDLKVNYDILIFTTYMDKDIVEFRRRFRYIKSNNNPTILHILYTDNTIEYKNILGLKNSHILKIENKNLISEKNVHFDEKNNSIILE